MSKMFLPHVCHVPNSGGSLYNYQPPPLKRQRKNRQTQISYNPHIDNFEIELLHKRFFHSKYYKIKLTENSNDVFGHKIKTFIFEKFNSYDGYMIYKCQHSDCDSTINVYFNNSIYNITNLIIYGNLHCHESKYLESDYFPIKKVILERSCLQFMTIECKLMCLSYSIIAICVIVSVI